MIWTKFDKHGKFYALAVSLRARACHARPSTSHSRYTPFLAIVAAAIPAAGAPIAGGIIFIPVLQLDSLNLRNAVAFSSATQFLGVGIFAPV